MRHFPMSELLNLYNFCFSNVTVIEVEGVVVCLFQVSGCTNYYTLTCMACKKREIASAAVRANTTHCQGSPALLHPQCRVCSLVILPPSKRSSSLTKYKLLVRDQKFRCTWFYITSLTTRPLICWSAIQQFEITLQTNKHRFCYTFCILVLRDPPHLRPP